MCRWTCDSRCGAQREEKFVAKLRYVLPRVSSVGKTFRARGSRHKGQIDKSHRVSHSICGGTKTTFRKEKKKREEKKVERNGERDVPARECEVLLKITSASLARLPAGEGKSFARRRVAERVTSF